MEHKEKEPLRTKVKFTEEWMGNPIGSEKLIMTLWAKELSARKVVIFVEEVKEEKKEDKKNKEKKKEEKLVKEDKKDDEDDTSLKLVRRAPKDKMMKAQEVK